MATSRTDRSAASAAPSHSPAAPRRADIGAARPETKPKPTAVSRANEIVRAIGLRPITGLSGPKIGY